MCVVRTDPGGAAPPGGAGLRGEAGLPPLPGGAVRGGAQEVYLGPAGAGLPARYTLTVYTAHCTFILHTVYMYTAHYVHLYCTLYTRGGEPFSYQGPFQIL